MPSSAQGPGGKKGSSKVAPETQYGLARGERSNTEVTNTSTATIGLSSTVNPETNFEFNQDQDQDKAAGGSQPPIPPSRPVDSKPKDETDAATQYNMASATAGTDEQTQSKSTHGRSRSHALLTAARGSAMGNTTSPYWWRKVTMNPNHLQSKMKALAHKIEVLQNHNYTAAELEVLRANVAIAIRQGHKTRKGILEFLQQNTMMHDPKITVAGKYADLFDTKKGALVLGMQQQFGRGLPGRISQVPLAAIILHDDTAFGQRFDFSNEYEAAELYNTIEQMITYKDVTITLKDEGKNGCDITSNDQSFGASCTLRKDKNGHETLEFATKDNSPASLDHFADLISMMRQGETNTIKFTSLGEPIAALALLHDLLIDKHMHIILTEKAQEEFLAGLQGNKKLLELADIYLANLQTFHTQDPRALSTRYIKKSSILGSYANEVQWKDRTAKNAAQWLYEKTRMYDVALKSAMTTAKASTNAPASSSTNVAPVAADNTNDDHDHDDVVVSPTHTP